jgi:hypothetical protein
VDDKLKVNAFTAIGDINNSEFSNPLLETKVLRPMTSDFDSLEIRLMDL